MTFALAVMMCRSLPTNACQAARHGGEAAVAFSSPKKLFWTVRDGTLGMIEQRSLP